jgi:endonuclease YncB( thermonuclease family)
MRTIRVASALLSLLATTSAVVTALHSPALSAQPAPAPPSPRPSPSPQPRPHDRRVTVDPSLVGVDDGDTVVIRWNASDAEQVRILGIDTPETRHVEHDLPYDQQFGPEAQAFARGAFAAADRIELRRSSTLDPFGRTLGYLWIDGRNYSVMVVTARLAEESVTRYGDNGLPQEAAEVLAAARQAGPLPFESPGAYRGRMRDVARWMKERGIYPTY